MNRNKIVFYAIWIFLLSLGPISVLSTTPLAAALRSPSVLTNFIQRLLGLTAFTLLFWQLMLGAFMMKFTEKLGGWVFRFHIIEGLIIYAIIILHPVFFMLFNYFGGKGLDPFYIFVQACILCQNKFELYYSLGRISFWLINITVLAGLFRAATPFMQMHWRKFHVLNYLVFLIIGIHGLSVGTDFRTLPFFAFAVAAYLTVLYVVIVKKLPELFRSF